MSPSGPELCDGPLATFSLALSLRRDMPLANKDFLKFYKNKLEELDTSGMTEQDGKKNNNITSAFISSSLSPLLITTSDGAFIIFSDRPCFRFSPGKDGLSLNSSFAAAGV